MKVAILSESPADEAALHVLIGAVLGEPVELSEPSPRARPGGWPSVRDLLPAVIRHLHYQTDAEGLVVVGDSNSTPVDPARPREGLEAAELSRLVQLRQAASDAIAQLRHLPHRPSLKVAVGLAVPAIEAWLVCGAQPNVSENAWVLGLREGRTPYTKNELKRLVYGSDRPGRQQQRQRAIEQAQRVAGMIDELQRRFSIGFGALADALRGWLE